MMSQHESKGMPEVDAVLRMLKTCESAPAE